MLSNNGVRYFPRIHFGQLLDNLPLYQINMHWTHTVSLHYTDGSLILDI